MLDYPATLEQSIALNVARSLDPRDAPAAIDRPKDRDAFWHMILALTGIRVPRIAVCDHHVSPFDALADAYFADSETAVWKASRGFGGKSLLLAILAFMEAVTLGAVVNLLGGSGKQSKNVHDYLSGESENLPATFWMHRGAPIHLLRSDPSHFTTRLTNYGRINVLMASSRSVRGPHPQRLRCDEVDEMTLPLLDAALGQPQESRGIREHTVLSSTHQYADGTMTAVLERANEKNWRVQTWCYRECLEPHGWLSRAQVERKRVQVTTAMWETEYELQEPDPGSRAIQPEKVKAMFNRERGEFDGRPGEYLEFEAPDPKGLYATGADWAKKRDWTIIVTVRVDVRPVRIVAFEREGRMPWPYMIGKFNDRLKRFPHPIITTDAAPDEPVYLAAHDATGLGDVVAGFLEFNVFDVIMMGRPRSDMLSEYIAAVENGEYVSPFIKYMETEHRQASRDHVYGAGHLPDTIAAMAVLHRALTTPITIQRTGYEPVRVGRFA